MWLLALAVACRSEPEASPTPDAPHPLLGVPEGERWSIPGLTSEAYVLRTPGNVPYLYAENRADLGRVQGFVLARDRYFELDLARRLSQGRLSELLGDLALSADQESRGIGMTHVVDQILARLDEDPALAQLFDGTAAGISAYVAEAQAGRLPPPSEYDLLGGFLGATDPSQVLTPFDRRDVAAIAATIVFELGYETGDIGRQDAADQVPLTYADGEALVDLRRAGLVDDVWSRIAPVFPVASAPGWGTAEGARQARPPRAPAGGSARRAPAGMLRDLKSRLDRIERRFGHDHLEGFGSNAWAMTGDATADGRSLLAGDGHLPLSVPSLFTPIGLDTRELGGGAEHQVGLVIPGLPVLAVGTNGAVAWSQTQLMGDITDWFLEEIQLGSDGLPASSQFRGQWEPLTRTEEALTVADVPSLGSVGRSVAWTRFTTFDGRWITDVEGRTVAEDEALGAGEGKVQLLGVWKVPADQDGDGRITAVSFDYTGLDLGHVLHAVDDIGHAGSVAEVREATRGLVAYSQNIVAADTQGSVLYTGYQAVPCRTDLPRGPDGDWVAGANPSRLLDGTQYGGFRIAIDADFRVIEGDPDACVVPFDAYPQNVDPASGYVLTANNDIAGLTFDDDLTNEPWYVGGPWLEGYRAHRIDQRLGALVGQADLAAMADVQADHHSILGEQWLGVLLAAMDAATTDPALQAYAADPRFAEARSRLEGWRDRGFHAASGVQTFYSTPGPDDAADAVATTLFNAWIGRFVGKVLDDEGWPDVFEPTGDTGRTRTLQTLLNGRGPGNPSGLSSWNPDTEESAFFDVRGTAEIETSDQLALVALTEGLDFLESAPTAPGEGGFGSTNMDDWLWGLRHVAKFESVLGEFLSAEDSLGFLVDLFSIDTQVLPLADDLGPTDPRDALQWFPRPGDHLNVDAGNSGFDGVDFSYGSGPVFRMVFALGPDGVDGLNVIPGGTSGLTDSPYFADQAALWLGNQALDVPVTVDEVIAVARTRETYTP